MGRNYGISDIENWKFEDVQLPSEWASHLGNLSGGFRMLIQGAPKNGKTEYLTKLIKMLCLHYGKVNLNNTEQGKSSSLKAAMMRNTMRDVVGKLTVLKKEYRTFEPWFKYLQGRNTGRVIALDSLDYMKLTVDQFKQLHERFPKKSIIIVCWDDPMDINAKKIKYMCDIIVDVKDFKANIRSRFGGNKPFVIWDKKTGQIKLEL